jgi:hypothetical protein
VKGAVLLLFACGCVPASEERPPAGAAGFDTVPSRATQGEAFATSDGWTLHVEKLVFQVSVSASADLFAYGLSEPYVFDAQKPTRVFARALPVGPGRVNIMPYGRYIGYTDNDYVDRVERINVDDETNARFNRLPDEGQESPYTPGPSVLVIVRGERVGSVLRLDAALNVTASAPPRPFDEEFEKEFGVPVEVRKNDVSTVALPIDAAAIFPTFDDLARSDADGDGKITASELTATGTLSQLEQRIANVLVR